MRTTPQQTGRFGEDVAAQWLTEHGYVILDRNWRCSSPIRGEVDIIARDGSTLVFIEVKTRTTTHAGYPAEAVTPAKLVRLRQLTAAWLNQARLVIQQVRIDVISIVLNPAPTHSTATTGGPYIDHVKDVRL
ncbi:YraN family protein [Jonesia quinghaiensis]|uniref:YraN family protein n=1 Tax=Jonesia quinghaiensis TaxID=262806 RepID=UPI000417B89C|nr:YraN family protein [Jonesia quinghaiensis]